MACEKIQKIEKSNESEKPEEPEKLENPENSENTLKKADKSSGSNVKLTKRLIEKQDRSRVELELELAVAELQNDSRRLLEQNGRLAKTQILLKEKPHKHDISRKQLDLSVIKRQKEKKVHVEKKEQLRRCQVSMTKLVDEHERSTQEQELMVASQREEADMLHREQHVRQAKLREADGSQKRVENRGDRMENLVEKLRAGIKNSKERIRLLERLLDMWKWNDNIVKIRGKR